MISLEIAQQDRYSSVLGLAWEQKTFVVVDRPTAEHSGECGLTVFPRISDVLHDPQPHLSQRDRSTPVVVDLGGCLTKWSVESVLLAHPSQSLTVVQEVWAKEWN